MHYPPSAYRVQDLNATLRLIRSYPFAHVFTAHSGLRATRVPVLADAHSSRVWRLRGHLDVRNPQARELDGAYVLVAFSGPAAYVSPNWRADKTKGGTYDYQEVQVRGLAHVVQDSSFFTQLVNDLSALVEPQHKEVGDYPLWTSASAPEGHIARQTALVTPFIVDVESVETTFKLHQNFPEADRHAVAEHLARSSRHEARAIGAAIREQLTRPGAAAEGPVRARLADVLLKVRDHWNPRIVSRYNGNEVRLVKASGEFIWHTHADSDELFLVLDGELEIEMQASTVRLGCGDLYVVPRGVKHRPRAPMECSMLVLNQAGEPNTGGETSPMTRATLKDV